MSLFSNAYRVREVAATDSKSCFVCYKFTTKVMLLENKADFFYICPSHLLDPTFATPVHPPEYDELIKLKTALVVQTAELQRQINDYGFSWDIIPGFGKKGKPENDQRGDKAEEGEKDPKLEKASLKELQFQLSSTKAKIEEIESRIKAFPFKDYNLDKSNYNNRLTTHYKVKAAHKRQQDIQKPGFFPSAPTSALENKE